jgi:protocatechuate 3,4-dioxygenase alpha subunit
MTTPLTPSQTVGPFFHIGLPVLKQQDGSQVRAGGEWEIRGRMVDGDGKTVSDALVEIWHADSVGRYPDAPQSERATVVSAFANFARVPTDESGAFNFSVAKPGHVPGPQDRLQAPHLVVTIFARGLLKQLMTRMYFPDEPSNDEDPVLSLVPAGRRHTLIARRTGNAEAATQLEWNIVLQGEDETVFFDL